MTLQDRAVGGSQEPTPGPDTHRRQVAQLGYNSTTKSGLKVGKAWADVPRVFCYPSSVAQNKLKCMEGPAPSGEKDPVLKQRIQYFLPDAVA